MHEKKILADIDFFLYNAVVCLILYQPTVDEKDGKKKIMTHLSRMSSRIEFPFNLLEKVSMYLVHSTKQHVAMHYAPFVNLTFQRERFVRHRSNTFKTGLDVKLDIIDG